MDAISQLKNDRQLKAIIETIDLPPVLSTNDVFHDLVSCIVEQQIHYRSTKQVFARMLREAGLDRVSPDNFDVFEKAGLPQARLSAAKYETLYSLLEFWQAHELDWHQLTDAEVYAILQQVKGLGKWSADMVLLYTLNRPDIFPEKDYHLGQIFTRLYGLNDKQPSTKKMLEIAAAWAPYRSLAVRYLLAWKQQAKVRKYSV